MKGEKTMIFADKLIQLRRKSGWSQEELAEQMDVSRQSVSKWEGAQSVPDLEKMVRLSKLFGVSTDYLLKDEIEEVDGAPAEEESPLRRVSMEEAQCFLSVKAGTAGALARAVSLCILSPACLIFLGAASEVPGWGVSEALAVGVGMGVLLALVALAVAQFIAIGGKTEPFRYLERESFETEYGVRGMVQEKRENYREAHNRSTVAGVCICILSVLPLFLGDPAGGGDLLIVAMVDLLLLMVGAGVYMLIRSGVIWASYNKLLEEGEYIREEKAGRSASGAISTAYWLVVVAVYLAISLPADRWDRSWILWPVAGVLFAVVRIIASGVARGRK